jgi:hypothetical protein
MSQLAALQDQIAALSAPAPAPVATPAPVAVQRDANGITESATKNATLQAIDNKLATLGKSRADIEAQAGFPLTSGSVRALRDVNRVLGERIARNAKRGK